MGRKNKGGENKSNEEDGNDQEKKTAAKVYDLNIDKEINEYFGTSDHENNSDNNNKQHIPRSKGKPIKKKKKNKPSSTTVKETSLKSTHTKETNKVDKYDTMNTSYNT